MGFQVWAHSNLYVHINPLWTSNSRVEARWGDDASTLYYWYLQTKIIYKIANWISVAPGYRQAFSNHVISTHWIPEYCPLFDVMLKGSVSGWSFTDRNRVEYIIIDSDPFHWLYRNRFRIVAPPVVSHPKFALFMENEIFWRQARGLNQDRLSAGFMIMLQEAIAGDIYYMARFLKRDPNWIYETVFNIAIVLSF